jgi:hypothetical protein
MTSIKLHDDTLAVLKGLRGRLGASYDEVVQELVRRQIDATTGAVTAGDRLRRIEEMLVQLTLQKQEDDDGGDGDGTPPTYDVK